MSGGMPTGSNTGNAGEFLVLTELLHRDFHAGLAERGNPVYDILARYGSRYTSLRVKASRSRKFQWSATGPGPGHLSLPGLHPNDETDFTVLVAFNDQGPRSAEIYIVPSLVVERTLTDAHEHYHRYPNRHTGRRRKRTNLRAIELDREDSEDIISRDFARKWAEYREAWHLLRG